MLLKRGEGLAKRMNAEHHTHFGYFMAYICREMSTNKMSTVLPVGWISYIGVQFNNTADT